MEASASVRKPSRSARLRGVVFSPTTLWKLARESVAAWIDDYAPSMGAAIAYYTGFSLAPLLLIVIALLGMVFGRDAAAERIFSELRGALGPEAAAAIQSMVESASSPGKSLFGTIAGTVMLLVGATTVFAEVQSALDRIWRTPAATGSSGIWHLVRERFLSFGLILAVGFLLLVSLVVSSGLSALGTLWAPLFENWLVVLQIVNFFVSIVVVTVLFALIYKLLPRAQIGWEDVWVGAAVTAILFSIGKLLLGLYIGKSGIVSGLGAAGAVLVILLWVYYSAQIFLLGAEFTWHYAYRFGSRRGESPPSAAVAKSAVAAADPRVPPVASPKADAVRTAPQPPASLVKTAPTLAGSVAGGFIAGHLVRRYRHAALRYGRDLIGSLRRRLHR